jgi:hypothetical protein
MTLKRGDSGNLTKKIAFKQAISRIGSVARADTNSIFERYAIFTMDNVAGSGL